MGVGSGHWVQARAGDKTFTSSSPTPTKIDKTGSGTGSAEVGAVAEVKACQGQQIVHNTKEGRHSQTSGQPTPREQVPDQATLQNVECHDAEGPGLNGFSGPHRCLPVDSNCLDSRGKEAV